MSFIGHVMTKAGLKVDPKKVEVIAKMEWPADVPAVQRFIGLAKYLSKFLQGLSEMCKPPHHLTHKKAYWNWTHEQEDAFEQIKEAVVKAPVLKYVSKSDPTEGQRDACQHGLEFVLLQPGQPVTSASRALTSVEHKYSQIEKELLAQVLGMEHNHQYVFDWKGGGSMAQWSGHWI